MLIEVFEDVTSWERAFLSATPDPDGLTVVLQDDEDDEYEGYYDEPDDEDEEDEDFEEDDFEDDDFEDEEFEEEEFEEEDDFEDEEEEFDVDDDDF